MTVPRRLPGNPRPFVCLVSFTVVCLTVVATADTLVLRDGRRVQGELIDVRNGVIEFEQRRGFFGGGDRLRVDRADVARIELDEAGGGTGVSGSATSRPPGLRERTVSVSSGQQWTDPGVSVRAGQTVYFHATGRVRWGPGRQDGPGGENGSPVNNARPMPARPAAGLIGRIGETDEYFFIGADEGPVRMRSSGQLYLGINDDYLPDNTGSFQVTVFF